MIIQTEYAIVIMAVFYFNVTKYSSANSFTYDQRQEDIWQDLQRSIIQFVYIAEKPKPKAQVDRSADGRVYDYVSMFDKP